MRGTLVVSAVTQYLLVLGLWYAFVIFLVNPLLPVKRIRNEEEVLERDFPVTRSTKSK